jgi:hypothetical protein
MRNRFLFLFIILIVNLGGCAKKMNFYQSDKVIEDFQPLNFEFDYLTAKARIVLEESNGKTTKGTFHLRAKKDSVVWFSMTPGLGIEALRGIVTADRIRIKDRINQQDIDMSFEEFEDKFGIKLSLDLFQNLLYANIPTSYSFRDRLLRVGKFFELTQTQEGVRYFSKINTRHGKVEELTSTSLDERGVLLANYQNFKNINNQPFPNKILYKISFRNSDENNHNHSIVQMEMNKIDLTETAITFPFRN